MLKFLIKFRNNLLNKKQGFVGFVFYLTCFKILSLFLDKKKYFLSYLNNVFVIFITLKKV